ncbi:MAG: response regulator transcription factor [Acidimicrobiales bacterium]
MRADLSATASDEIDGDWWWQVWRSGATSVLVVSDRGEWCEATVGALEAQRFAVRVHRLGEALATSSAAFDIAVVDLGLSVVPVGTVLRGLRAASTRPILAVAPAVAPESAVLEAYAAGVDQCLTRPGRPDELIARVRALLRRTPARGPDAPELAHLAIGGLLVQPFSGDVTQGGVAVHLAPRELEVLVALVRRPGRVVPRRELLGAAGEGTLGEALDATVRRLRSKLEAVEGRRRIQTVRGVGFRYDPTGDSTYQPTGPAECPAIAPGIGEAAS